MSSPSLKSKIRSDPFSVPTMRWEVILRAVMGCFTEIDLWGLGELSSKKERPPSWQPITNSLPLVSRQFMIEGCYW